MIHASAIRRSCQAAPATLHTVSHSGINFWMTEAVWASLTCMKEVCLHLPLHCEPGLVLARQTSQHKQFKSSINASKTCQSI